MHLVIFIVEEAAHVLDVLLFVRHAVCQLRVHAKTYRRSIADVLSKDRGTGFRLQAGLMAMLANAGSMFGHSQRLAPGRHGLPPYYVLVHERKPGLVYQTTPYRDTRVDLLCRRLLAHSYCPLVLRSTAPVLRAARSRAPRPWVSGVAGNGSLFGQARPLLNHVPAHEHSTVD
jgi:hypothetical protein